MGWKYRVLPMTVAIGAACASSLATAAAVGEWNVQLDPGSVLRAGGGPTAARNWLNRGKAQLFKSSGGDYSFRILGESVDDCFQTEVAAVVTLDAATTTIAPTGKFRNCPKVRLVIKNDGTGGHVEVLLGTKSNASWAIDEDHEYDLRAR